MNFKNYFFILYFFMASTACADTQKLSSYSERKLASEDNEYISTDATLVESNIEEKSKPNGIDWSQPPVSCVEDVIPHGPDPQDSCPDFSKVNDPLNDWPQAFSKADIEAWKLKKRPLSYCRSKAVLDREAIKPGSTSKGNVENCWMIVNAVKNKDQKAKAVYAASRKYKMPAHVLTGALYQESLFSELGIAEDGGNFSCGVGQTNLSEWCGWASKQSSAKKQAMNWPNISCSELSINMLRPFYEIALTKLNGIPEYQLNKTHFADIKFNDVDGKFSNSSFETQKRQFQAVMSFINTCSNINEGIEAKANELAKLYANHVPSGFKNRELYKSGEKFNLNCKEVGDQTYYPLHTGWLMAVGAYNAGPIAIDALAYYNKLSRPELKDPKNLKNINPNDLSPALYNSGKYNPNDDRIHFTNLNGGDSSMNWYKQCILQRHISRVITHNIQPGVTDVVPNMEAKYSCAKSKTDPATGELISGVPPERQKSSGQKN